MWIKEPNPWSPHCCHCKHAEYTREFKMDYNKNVNPTGGYRHSSYEGWFKWPVGECKLHGEYAKLAIYCDDHEHKDGYEHWSYHPKYR